MFIIEEIKVDMDCVFCYLEKNILICVVDKNIGKVIMDYVNMMVDV